ncbi:MAG TPA: MDR family MFS transporter [Gaiellaceae bacterium]|nr:MDR family MFS transporter [Gaiellaceae bacterium]
MTARLRARLARRPPGYRFTIGRILAIYSGLMVTLLLAALDQTIVATALPRIVGDLGGLSSYSWVFTAYLLASTVTVPLYGKLGDVYGRRPLFFIAIGLFLAGSALCGAAWGMPELIVFRAIQGFGAGGLFPLSLAVVGSIVPPRDRGRYQGLIGGVFAAASIAGPAVGGFIVDNMSWRWVFYVNLPIGGLALLVIYLTMPKRAQRREHSIDWLGSAVLAAGTTALLLGLVWGGRDYPWTSGHVVGALAAAVVALALFAWVEARAPETILPFDLLRNSTVTASIVCVALVGMAMLGTIAFVPLFVQGVIGTSATSSGVVLTPFMLAAVTTSFVSGQLVSRIGRYRPNTIVGPIVLGIAMLLLYRMGPSATNGIAARNMVVAGIGLGMMMQMFVLSVQNSVPTRAMGSATALTQFARSIGATLGVTLMGVIVNQGLPRAARGHEQLSHRLPPRLRVGLANALHPAFLAAAVACGLVLAVSILWIREVPLRRGFEDVAVGDEASPHPGTRAAAR